MDLAFLTTLIIFNGCAQKKDNSSGSSNQESLSLNKGDYAVEISTSKLIWTGKEVSTKQHNGTLNIKFRIAYIKVLGQLCIDCLHEIYYKKNKKQIEVRSEKRKMVGL